MASLVDDDGDQSIEENSQADHLTMYQHEGISVLLDTGLGIIVSIAGSIGFYYTIRFASSLTTFQEFQIGGSCLFFAIAGVHEILYVFKGRLVLCNDYIEDQSIFWTRRFTRPQIAGKKTFWGLL